MHENNIGYEATLYHFQNTFYSFFNRYTLFYFLAFLAIYIVLFAIIGPDSIMLNRSIDFFVIIVLLTLFSIYYYFSINIDKRVVATQILNKTKSIVDDSNSIIIIFILILLFYATIFLCQLPMTNNTKSLSITFIEMILWMFFIFIVTDKFVNYLFELSLSGILFNYLYLLLQVKKEEEIVKVEKQSEELPIEKAIIIPVDNPKEEREVFNISNNLYTYDDAQAICKSYNSRLATYQEVEDSYNNGAEWCNYGWSDSQMILFPTQKSTWDKLQQTKDHKNDCGRPGINGGVITNPNMEFGVNCFGIKPAPKDNDILQMSTTKNQNIPKSTDEIILDAKVKFWKENSDKLITINSFNQDKWKEY